MNSFADLKALPDSAVKGKILLFNERFDKQLAAQNDAFHAYGQAVVYRMTSASPRCCAWRRRRSYPLRCAEPTIVCRILG